MLLSTGHSTIPHYYRLFVLPGRQAAIVAATAGVMIAGTVSGCSGAGAGPVLPAATAAALRQLKMAESTSANVRSLIAKIEVRSTGSVTGGMTGTIDMRMKPSQFIELKLVTAGAASAPAVQLDEILTRTAVYFRDPAFAKAVGKPWVKADLPALSARTGITVTTLLQNLEGSNPLAAASFFTASRNIRAVGSAMVNGTRTTVYAGSYSPSAALAELSPRQRHLLGALLRAIGNNAVRFRVWIDSKHLIRKAETTDLVHGQAVSTVFTVTAVNQPVPVRLPRTALTAPLPGSS